MDIEYLFKIIFDQLTKLQNSLKEQFFSKPITTMEDFRKAQGQLEGLNIAFDEIKEIKRKLYNEGIDE